MNQCGQNQNSGSCASQTFTGTDSAVAASQDTAAFAPQLDSCPQPNALAVARQAKHALGRPPAHLRHQTSMDFKEDMLRNRHNIDNENTFMEWVYPPAREASPPSYTESTVQWGSDSMFDAQATGAQRRVGVRQLTQFRLEVMPDEEEAEEEEEDEEDEAQDADGDEAPSSGSRSARIPSPESSVANKRLRRSRRTAPESAFTYSSAESAAGPSSAPVREGKVHRERLTIEQKRSNHIRHEQKRRGLIREGFKDLTELVPELQGGTWSRSRILFKAVEYLQALLERNEALQNELNRLQNDQQGK
ncbi:hypothetical protein NLG97_g322 [Lecanicillium saksenae]|uniref:Uncharacterized protein n=1 Tax=Lecanicillium saksenae TaxID=468837 RepID=A0ACC1R743_9HYPO|nr:hypothetical protein NLG97_g322 [Lecanicillium saksenae]